jgi:hypothetical protein
MIRLLADEHIDAAVVAGLFRRRPEIEFLRVQSIGLRSPSDDAILDWAAEHGFVLVTHDRRTIPRLVGRRLAEKRPVVGVLVASSDMTIGELIDELEIIATASEPEEWMGRLDFLPMF